MKYGWEHLLLLRHPQELFIFNPFMLMATQKQPDNFGEIFKVNVGKIFGVGMITTVKYFVNNTQFPSVKNISQENPKHLWVRVNSAQAMNG